MTFTPVLNFTGPASVSYRVNDNGGATSNTATLTVSVTNVNDAPTIDINPAPTLSILEDGTGSLH